MPEEHFTTEEGRPTAPGGRLSSASNELRMTIKLAKRKSTLGTLENLTNVNRPYARNRGVPDGILHGVYGLSLIGIFVVIILFDPVVTFTNWFLRMEEGSFIYRMWQQPPYELQLKAYVFNYTNVDRFLSGHDTKLRIEEVGPFVYLEKRLNLNMSVDLEREVLTMTPRLNLTFLEEKSVAKPEDITVIVPNVPLIAISTLARDRMPWVANLAVGTVISATNPQLFLNLTARQYLWGYNDPIVSLASEIVPFWIDFGKMGILDRFYDQKRLEVEMELELSERDNMKYSILKVDGVEGIREAGFTDLNTSIPCNRLKGTFEGLMINPGMTNETRFGLFRKQFCRVFPFSYHSQGLMGNGVPFNRYSLDRSSLNSSSPFACTCRESCLPDGFVDIAKCFYDFPVSLTMPHYMGVDPREIGKYEGMHPDRAKHSAFMDFEPMLGIPVKIRCAFQLNIAVRTSSANSITSPLDGRQLPLVWLALHLEDIPPHLKLMLKLRVIIAPLLVSVLEAVLILAGLWLLVSGVYKYRIKSPNLMINSEAHKECSKDMRPLIEMTQFSGSTQGRSKENLRLNQRRTHEMIEC